MKGHEVIGKVRSCSLHFIGLRLGFEGGLGMENCKRASRLGSLGYHFRGRDVCRWRGEEEGDFTSWTSLELLYSEEETESGEDVGRGWTEEGVFLNSLEGCSGSSWTGVSVLFPGKCGMSWIVLFAGKVGMAQTVLAAGKGRVSHIVIYLLLWECRSRDGSLGAWMLLVFLGGRSWRFGRFEVIPDSEVDILFMVARGTAFIGWTRGFGGSKSVGGKLIIWLYFPSGTGTWCGLEMAASGILGNCLRFFSMNGTAGMFCEFISHSHSAKPLTGSYRAFHWPLCSGLINISIVS